MKRLVSTLEAIYEVKNWFLKKFCFCKCAWCRYVPLQAKYTTPTLLPPNAELGIGQFDVGPIPPNKEGGDAKTKLKVKVRLNLNGRARALLTSRFCSSLTSVFCSLTLICSLTVICSLTLFCSQNTFKLMTASMFHVSM